MARSFASAGNPFTPTPMRVLPLVATLCLVAVGGCDSAVQQVALNVTLLNESTGPIHILGPDEDFNPGNQVAAGNSRFVEVFIQPITSSSRAPCLDPALRCCQW